MEIQLAKLHSVMAEAIGLSRYDMWIKPSKMQISSMWINLFAQNAFVYERLCSIHGQLNVAIRQAFPQYVFRVLPPTPKEDISSLSILDQFITGQENKLLSSLLKKIATQKKWEYGVLFIYGEDGLGKSLFLKTLSHARKNIFQNQKILFLKGKDLWNHFLLSQKKSSSFFADLDSYDMWLIDDLFLHSDGVAQKEFLKAINKWQETPRPLIVTSSNPLSSFSSSLKALYSRLTHGLSVRLDPPKIATKLAILQTHYPSSMRFSREVLELFAQNLSTSKQVFESLKLLKGIYGTKASLKEGKYFLQKFNKEGFSSPIDLLQEIATYFGVHKEVFSRKNQKRKFTQMRRISTYLMHLRFHYSLEEIQPLMGNLNMVTLKNYCKQIEKEMKVDGSTKNTVQSLLVKLKAPVTSLAKIL